MSELGNSQPSGRIAQLCRQFIATHVQYKQELSNFEDALVQVEDTLKFESFKTRAFRNKTSAFLAIVNDNISSFIAESYETLLNSAVGEHNNFFNGLIQHLQKTYQEFLDTTQCFNKVQQYYREFDEINHLVYVDKIMKRFHSEIMLDEYAKYDSTSPTECLRDGLKSEISLSYREALTAINEFSKNYARYSNYKPDDISCSIDGSTYTLEEVVEKSETFLYRFNNLVKYNFDGYLRGFNIIIAIMQLNYEEFKSKIGEITAVEKKYVPRANLDFIDNITMDTFNAALSEIEDLISESHHHIKEADFRYVQEKFDKIRQHKDRFRAISEKVANLTQGKQTTLARISSLDNHTTFNEAIDTEVAAIKEVDAKCSAMKGANVNYVNIEQYIKRISDLDVISIRLVYQYEHMTKNRVESFIETNEVLHTYLIKLDGDIAAYEPQVALLIDEYTATMSDFRRVRDTKLLQYLTDLNEIFFIQNWFFLEDSLRDLNEALDKVTNALNELPQLENAVKTTNSQISAIKTTLVDYDDRANFVKSDFASYVASTTSHPSKLLQSFAEEAFNSIKISYKRNIDNVGTAQTNLDTDVNPIVAVISEVTTSRKTFEQLKTSINSAINEVNKANATKLALFPHKSKYPREFRIMVVKEVRKAELAINSESLLSSAKSAHTTVQELKKVTFTKDFTSFNSTLNAISNDVSSLESLSNETKSDVSTLGTQLDEVIGQLTNLQSNAKQLEKSTSDKYNSFTTSVNSKKEAIGLSTGEFNATYESEKQKVLSEQLAATNFLTVTTDFYKTKYDVQLRTFDEQYAQLTERYNAILREMASQNTQFKKSIDDIISKVDHFKTQGTDKYTSHEQSTNHIMTSLNNALSEIKQSADINRYVDIIATCKTSIDSYSPLKTKSDAFNDSIDDLIRQVAALQMPSNSFNQFTQRLTAIVNDTKTMERAYEQALKNEYVRINKVSFQESETQEFFDSTEQKHNFVKIMSLAASTAPITSTYDALVVAIGKQVQKHDQFKSTYPRLNVDSIVTTFYPQLVDLVGSLTAKKKSIEEQTNTLSSVYGDIQTTKASFNSEKSAFEAMYTTIEDLKTQYESKLAEILTLSNDKASRDNTLEVQLKSLNSEKTRLLNAVKEKTQEFKQIFNTLRAKESAYSQLLSTLNTTNQSLVVFKTESERDLSELTSKNDELGSYLEKVSAAITKKEQVVSSLTTTESEVAKFINEYPPKLESQKAETTHTIDEAANSLIAVKTVTTSDKAKLTNAVAEFSEKYKISNEKFSSEINGIIDSENSRLSENEQHCDKHILSTNTKRKQIVRALDDVNSSFNTESSTLSQGLNSAIAQLDCCMSVLNGQECASANNKNAEQCLSYVSSFNPSQQSTSFDELTKKFNGDLDNNQLNHTGDEFGTDALTTMATDSSIVDSKLKELEGLFKKEFKKTNFIDITKMLETFKSSVNQKESDVTANYELVSSVKPEIGNTLDLYGQRVNQHEAEYTDAKSLFTQLSEKTLETIRRIVADNQNTYINEEIQKEPTVSKTFSGFVDELTHDKTFVEEAQAKIVEFGEKSKELFPSLEANVESYGQLKKDVASLETQLSTLNTNDDMIEKDVVEQNFNDIVLSLTEKQSELEATHAEIVQNGREIRLLRTNVNSDYEYSLNKIGEFVTRINQNKAQERPLTMKLNSFEESSTTLNKSLGKLAALKEQLETFKGVIETNKQKSAEEIGSKISEISSSVETKTDKLEADKTLIEQLINEFLQKYQTLSDEAQKQSIDIPTSIDNKYIEYTKLVSTIPSEKGRIKLSLDNYKKDCDIHYAKQNSDIAKRHKTLSTTSANNIRLIDELESKIKITSVNNEPEKVYTKYETLVRSVEDFLENSVVFNFEEYTGEQINTSIRGVSQQTRDDIVSDVKEIEKTYKAINHNNDNTATREEPEQDKRNVEPISYEDQDTIGTHNHIAGGEARNVTTKDYFKIVIGIASVAIVALVIGGAVLYYRNTQRKKIFSKCDNIYIKA